VLARRLVQANASNRVPSCVVSSVTPARTAGKPRLLQVDRFLHPRTVVPSSYARRFVLATVLAAVAGGVSLVACNESSSAPPTVADAGLDDAQNSGFNVDGGAQSTARPAAPYAFAPTAHDCGTEPRPAGSVAVAVDGGECSGDQDCTAGEEGRCEPGRGSPSLPTCSYHACSTDQDCQGATSVCGCGIGWAKQNLCLSNSNCRTDSDCAFGERCLFSGPVIFTVTGLDKGDEIGGVNYQGEAVGFFCTTPKDDCTCPHDSGQASACVYNIDAKHWQCAFGP